MDGRPENRPTLEDVARRAGFALRTTKKVISGNEHVPEETRRRVLQAAAELGYRKNSLASALAQAHSERVALVYSEVTKEYFPEVAEGFKRFADEHYDHGFEIQFVTSRGHEVADQAETLRRLAHDESITCVALQPLSASGLDAAIAEVVAAGKPVVTFGSDAPDSQRLAYLGPDAYKSGRIGAQILANYVGKAGEVLIVSRAREHLQTRDRRRGFLDMVGQYYPQIEPQDLVIEDSDQTYAMLRERVEQDQPAGIFLTFAEASTAGQVLEDLGLSGVTLVGFDLSTETAELMRRGYVKVILAQGPGNIAYQSLKLLFDHLYRDTTPTPITHTDVTILTSECLD